MEIPRKVEIQLLHGDDLGVSPSRGAALDAKAGPQGGLPQRHYRLFPKLSESLAQAYAGGGLALSRRSGVDGGHQNQLSVRPLLQAVQILFRELCLVLAVELQVILPDPQRLRHFANGLHYRFLRNLQICLHASLPFLLPIPDIYQPFQLHASPSAICQSLRLYASPSGYMPALPAMLSPPASGRTARGSSVSSWASCLPLPPPRRTGTVGP